jgi:hypothetical protein
VLCCVVLSLLPNNINDDGVIERWGGIVVSSPVEVVVCDSVDSTKASQPEIVDGIPVVRVVRQSVAH